MHTEPLALDQRPRGWSDLGRCSGGWGRPVRPVAGAKAGRLQGDERAQIVKMRKQQGGYPNDDRRVYQRRP
jgi:hypothetical protein